MSYLDSVYGPAGPSRQPTGTAGPDQGAAVTGEKSTRTREDTAGGLDDPALVLVLILALAAVLGFVSVRVEVGR